MPRGNIAAPIPTESRLAPDPQPSEVPVHFRQEAWDTIPTAHVDAFQVEVSLPCLEIVFGKVVAEKRGEKVAQPVVRVILTRDGIADLLEKLKNAADEAGAARSR